MSGSILVVGAGIAGRAVTRTLARHGLDCTVVERRRSTGRGMGLNLPGNAVRALRHLGVPDEALSGGVPVRRREYRNAKGRLLFGVDEQRFWSEVAPPVCLRHGDLLAALAFPDGVMVEHARAITARPMDSGVEVVLDGASPRSHDFVIGADGAQSAMRAAVADSDPRPSSMTDSCWRFIADNPGVDCWTAWSGREETFLLIPVDQGRVYGYAARTRGGAAGGDPTWLAQAASSFPAVVGRAVASGLEGGEFHRATVGEVRLPCWHNRRLVLIGDAAHATGPGWAQGVAMALEDAIVIGELLAATPTKEWAGVGATFEARRRPRVDHVRAATEKMSRLAGMPGFLRDAVAPVLGPRNYRAACGPLRAAVHP